MAIFQYLDISTAHVTEEDMAKLDAGAGTSGFPVTVYPYTHGAFIPTPPNEKDLMPNLRKAGMSDSFCKIVQHVISNKIHMIRLDCDADTMDDFPTFDW